MTRFWCGSRIFFTMISYKGFLNMFYTSSWTNLAHLSHDQYFVLVKKYHVLSIVQPWRRHALWIVFSTTSEMSKIFCFEVMSPSAFNDFLGATKMRIQYSEELHYMQRKACSGGFKTVWFTFTLRSTDLQASSEIIKTGKLTAEDLIAHCCPTSSRQHQLELLYIRSNPHTPANVKCF